MVLMYNQLTVKDKVMTILADEVRNQTPYLASNVLGTYVEIKQILLFAAHTFIAYMHTLLINYAFVKAKVLNFQKMSKNFLESKMFQISLLKTRMKGMVQTKMACNKLLFNSIY